MARILAAGAGQGAAASAALGPPWFFGLCMVVVSVWIVTFAVFLCNHSDDADDRPKKKPAPAPATKKKPASRGGGRSGTVVGTTGMYPMAYGGAAACGCSGGHGGHAGCGGGHAGCGGGHGGCGGGGGGGCGGGGGGC
ncbi:hypothetical protein ACP70R_007044 [Stipagrostis hirtigluma subsp. patula]